MLFKDRNRTIISRSCKIYRSYVDKQERYEDVDESKMFAKITKRVHRGSDYMIKIYYIDPANNTMVDYLCYDDEPSRDADYTRIIKKLNG